MQNVSSLTDLYRAKYNLPQDGEGPERYLATKVPLRKNKDHRARFRNFVMGYPIYKKDNYTRHYHNFLDIIENNEAPLLRYPKTFFKFYFLSFIPALIFSRFMRSKRISMLSSHKIETTGNYVDFQFYGNLRKNFGLLSTTCGFIGSMATGWLIFYDYIKYFLYNRLF